MKYNNETMAEWAEKVRRFEYGRALQRLANGDPPEQVIEQMANRIMEKMKHPIMSALTVPKPTEAQIAEWRRNYEEKYVKNMAPRADQIDGNIFDKPE